MSKQNDLDPFDTGSQGELRRWVLPEALKQAAITRLAMFISDVTQQPWVVISAIRALVEISKLESSNERFLQANENDSQNDMPQVVYSSKEEMDALKSMTVVELLEYLGHPLRDEVIIEQKRTNVTDAAKARAERSMQAITSPMSPEVSRESKPKAKILPHTRRDES